MEQDAISRPGFNGPYIESTRQAGFVTYGISNVMRLLGAAEVSMIPSWYQKWQVHNLARPEALAGTVHNTLLGFLDAPIHPSLLENTELLDRVAAANAAQNIDGSETFLLAQARRVSRDLPSEMRRVLRYRCRIAPQNKISVFDVRNAGIFYVSLVVAL